MAVDNRPFKSKEQDGQGNEVIIRDQQLVEQGTATTMASGAYFETIDVDDRPVKIPRDNMMNIVLECIGIILNDNSRNLGTNVQKALGLQVNTVGHSTVADFASVLGGLQDKGEVSASTSLDTVTSVGAYSLPNDHIDSPISGIFGIMAVYKSSLFIVQLVTGADDSRTFIRVCWGGTWKQWLPLDNFRCSTPSDLASLLGVNNIYDHKFKLLSFYLSVNEVIDTGITFYTADDNYIGRILLAFVKWHSGHSALIVIRQTSESTFATKMLDGSDNGSIPTFSVSNNHLIITGVASGGSEVCIIQV